MKSVFITGSCGFLGSYLVNILSQYRITGLIRDKYKTSDKIKYVYGDLGNIEFVKNSIEYTKSDIVIHLGALTDVDYCEINPCEAVRINYLSTKAIAELCRSKGIKLIFISTDFIFDGEKGPYSEYNIPGPINVYGSTKLMSEEFIMSIVDDYIICRITVPYGIPAGKKNNFGYWVYKNLHDKNKIKVARDMYTTPTYIKNIAEGIKKLIELDYTGTVNIADNSYISRYDFALLIAKVFNFDESLIEPIQINELSLTAKRPLKAGLKNDLCSYLGIDTGTASESIKKMKKEIKNNEV